MSVEITNAMKHQYDANFKHVFQQKGSRLMNRVDRKDGVQGRSVDFDLIGATVGQKKTSRNTPTPAISTPHSRRRAFLETFHWGDTSDDADVRRSIGDPGNKYLQAGVRALQRNVDDVIIAAMLGNATSVTGEAEVAASGALPASQKVPVAGAGLTLAKIITAKKMFLANEVDEEIKLYFAYNAEMLEDLLNDSTITSADYNTVRMLAAGKMEGTFMGFEWVHSERLTLDSNGDRQAIAWAGESVGLGISANILTKVAERSDLSFATQFYAENDFGAVRVQDVGVVEIAVNGA